jgi:hypothetical protein
METVKRCKVTIKVMYRTTKEAKEAIKSINEQNKLTKGIRTLKGFYLCEHCNKYHITSMSKDDKRKKEYRETLYKKTQENKEGYNDYINQRLELLKKRNKLL